MDKDLLNIKSIKDSASLFTIKSINVNSIGKNPKRAQIFHFLKKRPANVYILVDTRFDKNIENQVKTEWGGPAYFSSFNSQSRGVSILFMKGTPVKILDTKRDQAGNLLHIFFEFEDKKILLSGIYGPNNDTPNFYQNEVFSQTNVLNPDYNIYVGDWNVVLNQGKDTLNYVGENNVQARNKITEIMERDDLLDIWRIENENVKTYSWFKRDRINGPKCARLDFFLISESLYPYVKKASIEPAILTDHSMITLSLDFTGFNRGRGFWKFNNSLLKDQVYVDIIKWTIKDVTRQYSMQQFPDLFWEELDPLILQNLELSINPQLFFDVLLMEIRGETIKYSSSIKKERRQQYDSLMSNIEIKNEEFNENPENIIIKEELDVLKNEMEALIKYETEGAAIRSKAQYSLDGEKPNNFFCNLEKSNATTRYFSKLVTEDNETKYEQKLIEAEILKYYKNLYENKDNCLSEETIEQYLGDCSENIPKINNDQRNACEGEITLEEMGNYLKDLRNNKSPGISGFTGEFYKFFYRDLKHRLLASINHTYEIEKLSNTQNIGITTLIPKGNSDKEYLRNWRPLNLLNTQYKIISGCLAERLKPVLQTIINNDQKGYLPGRYIGEVTRNVYDTLHYAKNNNASGVILLCDFQKAFDSLSHKFILKTLEFFNFGPSLIKWVKILIFDFYSVINHVGNISAKYKLARGVKQGDPISGYLFILCSELLAHKIRNNPSIIGFQVGDHCNLLDLYADDLTVYLKAYENDINLTDLNIRCVITDIQKFYNISGLKINVEKTKAAWFGNLHDLDIQLCNDLGLQWVRDFKLLGLRFNNNLENMSEINLAEKVAEIKKLLNNWRYRYLTPFGKICIIKSLALSKLTHLSLILPECNDAFAQSLEKIFYNFIWDNKPDKINRETSKVNESKGGLNMVSVKEFWMSLKISWLRRFSKAKSFWKQILITELYKINVEYEQIFTAGSSKLIEIHNRITNPFWKDVFKCTAVMIDNLPYHSPHKFGLFSVCDNPLFKIGRETIKAGMVGNCNNLQVHDLLHSETSAFLSLEDFNLNNNLNLNFLQYISLKTSIISGSKKIHFNIAMCERHQRPRQPLLISLLHKDKKGGKLFYSILRSKLVLGFNPSKTEGKWHTELGGIIGVNTWDMYKSLCANIKFHNTLKWLQLKILNRIVSTNYTLSKFIPNHESTCNFCLVQTQTIPHLFYECALTSEFLGQLINFLLSLNVNIDLNLKKVLFGDPSKKAMSFENLMILYIKGFIWQCKIKNAIPTLRGFKSYLKLFLSTLKFVHTILNIEDVFNQNWYIYEHLLQE